jgi:hypothetical protein
MLFRTIRKELKNGALPVDPNFNVNSSNSGNSSGVFYSLFKIIYRNTVYKKILVHPKCKIIVLLLRY